MKTIITLLLALCSLVAASQNEQANLPTQCRKDMPFDKFLLPDDAAAAKATFEELRGALLSGDRARVIALVAFPADLVLDGRGVKFDTPRVFEKQYDKIFTTHVINSVREQDSKQLIAGWEGVSLSNHVVRFKRTPTGDFRIDDVRPRSATPPTGYEKEFLDRRVTCPPVVVEGRIAAFIWVSHAMPGFEDIYIDHFIVDVTRVLRGALPEHRIRVDFWGVTNLPEYNLPATAFDSGPSWRIYLRPADEPPENPEACSKDVQETISSVGENGREIEKASAITSLSGETSLTYIGLPCFEAHKQFFETATTESRSP